MDLKFKIGKISPEFFMNAYIEEINESEKVRISTKKKYLILYAK